MSLTLARDIQPSAKHRHFTFLYRLPVEDVINKVCQIHSARNCMCRVVEPRYLFGPEGRSEDDLAMGGRRDCRYCVCECYNLDRKP